MRTNRTDGPAPISSLTERVAYNTGNGRTANVYHAPTADGALCGVDPDRVVPREVLETHYRPCKLCYNLEE